jgi:hypothetical protein
MQTTAVASLTDHFHRFLEAVQEACGLHAGRGLLTAPMALLLWIRTRRVRKEAAAAMAEAFQALMQQFTVLLEDFRAGKLTAPNATPSPLVGEGRGGGCRTSAPRAAPPRQREVYWPTRSLPKGGRARAGPRLARPLGGVIPVTIGAGLPLTPAPSLNGRGSHAESARAEGTPAA